MDKQNDRNQSTYYIVIRGGGGYFTSGKICSDCADFWSKTDMNELVEHLRNPDDSDLVTMEDTCRLASFLDSAEVREFGFKEIDKVKVYSEEQEKLVASLYEEDLTIKRVEPKIRTSFGNFQGDTLFSRTSEWGHLIYDIKTANELDLRKLSFTEVLIHGVRVINGVFYDGVELNTEDEFDVFFEAYAEVNPNL